MTSLELTPQKGIFDGPSNFILKYFQIHYLLESEQKKKKIVSPEIDTWPSKEAKKILKGTFQFKRGNDPITNSSRKDSPVKPEAHQQWEFPGRN